MIKIKSTYKDRILIALNFKNMVSFLMPNEPKYVHKDMSSATIRKVLFTIAYIQYTIGLQLYLLKMSIDMVTKSGF